MITYRKATMADVPYIAKLSAESFGQYPLFHTALADSFADDGAYQAYMERLLRVHFKANMRQHPGFVGVEDGRIVSAALLQDPKGKRISIFDYIMAGAIGLVYPAGVFRLLNFFDLTEAAHKDCAREYPDAWYLELLAVDGSMKGKGLGSRMLSDCLVPYVRAQDGSDLTLITNTEGNRAFYKKNGFREFADRVLESGGRRIGNWSFRLAV